MLTKNAIYSVAKTVKYRKNEKMMKKRGQNDEVYSWKVIIILVIVIGLCQTVTESTQFIYLLHRSGCTDTAIHMR